MMKTIRIFLGILLAFVAVNAFGGGYYGLAGAENVPVEWLIGSPFKSYLLPSLFPFIVIGGSCSLASIMVFRNSKYAKMGSLACAILLVCWIIIQVAVIGYVSWMQPAVIMAATCIFLLGRGLK